MWAKKPDYGCFPHPTFSSNGERNLRILLRLLKRLKHWFLSTVLGIGFLSLHRIKHYSALSRHWFLSRHKSFKALKEIKALVSLPDNREIVFPFILSLEVRYEREILMEKVKLFLYIFVAVVLAGEMR